jgi:PrtD family type I secretion system ABC transporter
MLTLGVAWVCLVYVGLEVLRSRILVQAGMALDGLLSARVLHAVFERAAQPGGARHAGALRDVAVLRQTLTGNSLFAFFDAPWGLAFLAIIFIVHWALGVTALLGMVLLAALAWIDDRRTRPLLNQANTLSREASRSIDGALRHGELVQALGMKSRLVRRWAPRQAQVLAAQGLASQRAGTIVASAKGLRQMLQALMLALGAYLVITENLSSGTMIAATILLGKATAPLELAIAGWKGFVEARGAYTRLCALIAGGDPASAAPPLRLPAPLGALGVERAVYAAGPGQPAILKGVSFEVAAGESLAIIGPSAAGKSTLVRLLLGLWQPQSGCVRLDGASLADWPREALGPHLGYLPQDIELLAGSVAENIARMAPVAEHSEAIVAAARMAGAHELILRLPQGYETPIGEGSAVLSGGQRQRIALARALFGAPRLVLLDEPNSNLDTEGEQALVEALRALKSAGTTVVFVTHKPSLLNQADRVLVLDAGSVLACGPRDAILARLQGAGGGAGHAVASIGRAA